LKVERWNMISGLSEAQSAVLQALCDTFVPCIKSTEDPTGFWARTASDLGVDRLLVQDLMESVPEQLRNALLGLLDGLAARGFVDATQDQREGMLNQVRQSAPAASLGVSYFEKRTLLLTYGLPEQPVPNPNLVTYGSPGGQNPNWEILGYPGPVSVPPAKSKQIRTVTPTGDRMTVDADVCVVGSGAGGAVIAARMAMQGRRVVVLEMGGHYNSADFHQLELWGYKHLWYRGGATPTADGNVTLLAGSTLGGGTEINWMNCVRTPQVVREDWVRDYGLEGLDTPEFDYYMDVVEKRILSSPRTAWYNSQNLRMKERCERLGYLSKQTHVNWDPKLFNPLMAGYTGFGDQTGGKQTARRTYLLDAYRHGARIIVGCRADHIVVQQGRATGVEATWSDPQGRQARVTVRAAQVVVACGSLESPALLLRSGIGGPAVGKNLRVQPGGAVYGIYNDKQKGWWGSPMTANCEQFTDTGNGYGFYMEIPAFGPGFVASVIPWTSGRQHKEMMTKVPFVSTFIWFLRDRGSGEVTIDNAGNAVHTYQLVDSIDQKNFRRASAEAVRIHEAAGAREILFSLSHGQLIWKRGQDLENYIQSIMKQPLLDGAQPMISAHQLCTCRMGRDPATCVADTNGELYDVKGVWIGDASACPTSLGANPMVTIMALAERTATKMTRCPRPGVDRRAGALPSLSKEIVGLMTSPLSMLRELTTMMTNPFHVLTLGQRLLSGLGNEGPSPKARDSQSGEALRYDPPA
jgi:choline dehydrogenase-like flavoprotein